MKSCLIFWQITKFLNEAVKAELKRNERTMYVLLYTPSSIHLLLSWGPNLFFIGLCNFGCKLESPEDIFKAKIAAEARRAAREVGSEFFWLLNSGGQSGQ